MKIYNSEIKDGLESAIGANKSIACVGEIRHDLSRAGEIVKAFLKTKANAGDFDLYPINSILVSCGWNLNDDIFDKSEVWASRHTPEDKPFNLEHSPTDIIGHIIANYPVGPDLQPIDNDCNLIDLPEGLNIITASVIYRKLDNPEYIARMAEIIPQIENNEWFVSMECLFNNFDYGITKPNGSQSIIERNESTAYLTKYLRSYGGDGRYADVRIGRVLRNITFSGHGLVRQPANPNSIIFSHANKSEIFKSSATLLVYSNNINKSNDLENVNMSDELTIERDKLQARVNELEAQLATINITNVQAQLNSVTEELKNRNTAYADIETKYTGASTRIAELETALSTANTELESLRTEVLTLKSEKVSASRLAELLKLDLPEDKAKEIVAKSANVSDEFFNDVILALAKSWKEAGGQINTKFVGSTASVDEQTSDEIAEEVIETVEATGDQSTGTVASVENVRENLAEALGEWLGKAYLGTRRGTKTKSTD